jgi:23S rRNA (guanosine2251-2'-O)-methyltransferase
MQETLYGHHAVLEALRAGRRRFYEIVLAQGIKEQAEVAEILTLAGAKHINVKRVEREALSRLGSEARYQGVAAQVSVYPYADWDEVVEAALRRSELPLLLLLDCLQDPQNLGTLLRAAEAVGAHGVAITERRAAGITPAVSNASAGAVEHLHIAQVTNLARTVVALKEKGIWVAGLERVSEAKRFDQVDWNMPLALVVGSEGRGLQRLVRDKCDLLIELPMRGAIGSLNAAVAGSIVLYQVWQRRGFSM